VRGGTFACALVLVASCALDRSAAPQRRFDAGPRADASLPPETDSGPPQDAGACTPTGPEACNADFADEDCDGAVDEECVCLDGTTRGCGTSVGVCQKGAETCVSGIWNGECVGQIAPEPEDRCDGEFDHDCDGSVDESCGCTEGETTPCSSDEGACTRGTQTCTGGAFTACSGVLPRAETCNAEDDDCDGETDEGACTGCATASRDGHRYLICNARRSWSDARAFCQSSGYDLTKILDRGEESFVANRMRESLLPDAWIGLRGNRPYAWTDGSSFVPFTGNFENNESADCYRLQVGFRSVYWRDRSCSERFGFLCETPL